MARSRLFVLVVKRVGKFSLPEGRLVNLFLFFSIMAGFSIHREYEDSSNDLIC